MADAPIKTCTVKDVSRMAGISVRTLHHYDEFGILKPAQTSKSGYRLYSDLDLERLQEILFFKELGFSLKEIKSILDNPGYDRKQALQSHKKILQEKKRHMEKLISLVEKTLASMEEGSRMKNNDMFDGFDDSKLEEYKKEAKERWGHTEAYKESERRTSKYTKEDWDRIKAEVEDMFKTLGDLMGQGKEPADDEVQQQIKRWYDHINGTYYSCPIEMFRCLGDMYVDDPRFTATYDKIRPGLAVFKRDAMHIFCDRMSEKTAE
jgi:DNA-binding transcriptional MerR regulator